MSREYHKCMMNRDMVLLNAGSSWFTVSELTLRTLLRISCLHHKTNDWMRSKVNFYVSQQEPFLAIVRKGSCWFTKKRRGCGALGLTLSTPTVCCQKRFLLALMLVRVGFSGWITSSQGTFSGNCSETETHVVWVCHPPRQPLQNHSSLPLGKRVARRSTEKMMD